MIMTIMLTTIYDERDHELDEEVHQGDELDDFSKSFSCVDEFD